MTRLTCPKLTNLCWNTDNKKVFDNLKEKTGMNFMQNMGPNSNVNKKKFTSGCLACSRQMLLPWSKSNLRISLQFASASFQIYMFCFHKYMLLLHSTADISFQTITGVVLSLTLGVPAGCTWQALGEESICTTLELDMCSVLTSPWCRQSRFDG